MFSGGTLSPGPGRSKREQGKEALLQKWGSTDFPRHTPAGIRSHWTPPASSNGLQGLKGESEISTEAKHTLGSVA